MKRSLSRVVSCAGLVLSVGLSASAQLRVQTHNISFFSGGQSADIATAYYGTYTGAFGPQSMRPDLVMTLEFQSQAAVDSFLLSLNTAYKNATGDTVDRWSAAPFTNGPDTDSAVFYRNDKMQYLSRTLVIAGGDVNGAPRDIYRYDLKLLGYTSSAAIVSCYPVHFKSGSGSTDQARRQIEATAIRNNINAVRATDPLRAFVFGGDTNIQNSNQAAYQTLVSGAVNSRVNDPINSPGTWNNNSAFRFIHTQDPIGAGGMDDRHDQILISSNLIDGAGFDYIGNASIPYSTTSWYDPNHSYRAWGNDGTTFDAAMAIASNTFVGPAIAQALVNLCSGAGHLPVILDLRVPAIAAVSTPTINFGDKFVGDAASGQFVVTNTGDTAKWSVAGIANLNYSVSLAGAGFSTPLGGFVDAPNAGAPAGNTHVVSLNTATPGAYSGTVTITTDAPDQPTLTVTLSGNVYCPSDVNRDFLSDLADFFQFLNDFDQSLIGADVSGNGEVDLEDFFKFLNDFDSSC
jgi:hypothetical protein